MTRVSRPGTRRRGDDPTAADASQPSRRWQYPSGTSPRTTAPDTEHEGSQPALAPLSDSGVTPAPATSKYHARRVQLDGYTFDSRREAERYAELRLLERAGDIAGLHVHVPFDLNCCGEDGLPRRVARYVCDFVYREPSPSGDTWLQVVEDVKGVRTEAYRLKHRWMLAQYGIRIREVG